MTQKKSARKKRRVFCRKLFTKPVGPSERIWCNTQWGTLDQVLCEACGTVHPKLSGEDSSRKMDIFLGLQMVEECCGGVIDLLYKDFGQEFCFAFLEDFAKEPGNQRFTLLRSTLERIMDEARKNCAKVQGELDAVKPPTPTPEKK